MIALLVVWLTSVHAIASRSAVAQVGADDGAVSICIEFNAGLSPVKRVEAVKAGFMAQVCTYDVQVVHFCVMHRGLFVVLSPHTCFCTTQDEPMIHFCKWIDAYNVHREGANTAPGSSSSPG